MRPRTSTYRRKDGSRARFYLCRNAADATGLCGLPPIDAEVIDSHVIAQLDRFLGDVENWQEKFIDSHEAERAALERKAKGARAELDQIERVIGGLEARVESLIAAGDNDKADAALAIVAKRRPDRDQAQRRLVAIEDALATIPAEAPVDAMLDFYTSLREAIRGRLDRAGRHSMSRVNEALRDLFDRFVLDQGVPDGVAVLPVLAGGRMDTPQTFFSVADRAEDPPPLQMATSHE